ncbi:MAG TPA: hypothetical protein ENK31_00270, partial [Nannocystis exedens]|nr:hypothetical protein [Nannocystis exedens]
MAERRGRCAGRQRWTSPLRWLCALGFSLHLGGGQATAGPLDLRQYAGPATAPAPKNSRGSEDSSKEADSVIGSAAPGAELADTVESELGVRSVSVKLQVFRGGDTLPNGTRLRRNRGAVRGEAVYELTRPARSGDRLHLLNFAETLQEEPTGLDTIALSAYLDGPFDRGDLNILSSDGAFSIGRSEEQQVLEVVLRPGSRELVLRYEVIVPHRYWPFGCARRRCSLSGAVAPLPAEEATGGRYLPAGGWVITPAHWRIDDVRFAAVPTWQPGQVPTEEEAKALAG